MINLSADIYFGPYEHSNYRYLYIGASGDYSAYFGEMLTGEQLQLLYTKNEYQDRIQIIRHIPYVNIDHTNDQVYGAVDPGQTGTLTIRDDQGAIKAGGVITATYPRGFFSFSETGLDILPGDQVETQIGSLDRVDPVFPMSASLNFDTEILSGNSLPNVELGLGLSGPGVLDGGPRGRHAARSRVGAGRCGGGAGFQLRCPAGARRCRDRRRRGDRPV